MPCVTDDCVTISITSLNAPPNPHMLNCVSCESVPTFLQAVSDELTADLYNCFFQLYSCQGFPQLMVRPGTLWVHVAAQAATEQHRILHQHCQPAEKRNLCCLLMNTEDLRNIFRSPQHCSQLIVLQCNQQQLCMCFMTNCSTTVACLEICNDRYKIVS